MSITHSGTIEAGAKHLDVVAGTSFLDVVARPAELEPLIERKPGLFMAGWKGTTEAVALLNQRRVEAAGVLRSVFNNDGALEFYAVGEVSPGADMQILKEAMSDLVEARKAELKASQERKGEDATPIHATVHWGEEPPREILPADPGVGLEAFRTLAGARHQQFLDDLRRSNGGELVSASV